MAPNTGHLLELQKELLEALEAGRKLAAAPAGEEVCITGLAGIYPDSDNFQQFRDNLLNKTNLVTSERLRWTLNHPEIPKNTGKLNNLEKFDASFFGIHMKQAHAMDPMSRILLEKSFEAILDAGLNPAELKGTNTGVFCGACFSESEKTWFYEKYVPFGFGLLGCSRPMLANRISYWLGINGPSYTVDTACSSSLYALDHAYTAIRDGVCDRALVITASLCLHPYVSLQFSRLGVLSPQGRCKTFDEQANGYARSEAIGVLLLEKSKDARRIYATVVHTKTNCDGYKEQGITYPSGKMQRRLLEQFYGECQVEPSSLGWVEAHGTGTRVGDPEELNALDTVFCKGRSTPVIVGSVKSNMGHSEPASGFCSISKVIVSMETGLIPPNLHYESPREEVAALVKGNLKVVTEPHPWEGGLVGINSFGFGGANCHVLLKWNPKTKVDGGVPSDEIPRLVTVSGRTEKGVQQILVDLESRPVDAEYVNLYHHIHALNIPGHIYRGFTLLKQGESIRDIQFYTGKQPPEVWFVLSGLGGQWSGMGRSLLVIPAFAAAIDRCHGVLKPFHLNLRKIVTDDIFDNPIHTSVGVTAVQIGLVNVLTTVGIYPNGLIGHSVGDLAAGYADQCFTLEQTITAAYYRGLALLETDLVKGAMACVALSSSKVGPLLPQDVQVACHNGPASCIVSGPSKSVRSLLTSLADNGVEALEIECNNIAGHSQHVRGVGAKLIKYLQKVIPSPKTRSEKWVCSSLPKTEWTTQQTKLGSAEYLVNNFLQPVLFDDASAHIPNNAVVIEISPDAILQGVLNTPDRLANLSLVEKQQDSSEHLLVTIGKLYECGVQPQLVELYPRVAHPVSRSTPMISPLVDWEHSHDWFVTSYSAEEHFKSGERSFVIDTSNEDMAFYKGHVIDGRNLFPATGYLFLVWDSLAVSQSLSLLETSVVFENIRFHRATNIPKDGTVSLLVLVQKGSGNFEIVEGGAAIVTGRIYLTDEPTKEMVHFPPPKPLQGIDIVDLSSKDIYKELRLRGYNYSGIFKSIVSADNSGVSGKIRWQDNWAAFMDNMLQMQILTEDTRGLFVPTSISKLTVNVALHMAMVQATSDADQDKVLDVYVHREVGVICSGGVVIRGLKASAIARRKPLGDPVIEKYHFVPNTSIGQSENTPQDLMQALHVCIHLGLENQSGIKVKVVELIDDHTVADKVMAVLSTGVAAILGDLPLIQADITVLASANHPLTADLGSGIKVEDKKLSSEQSVLFVMGTDMATRDDVLREALGCLGASGYLISREMPNCPTITLPGIHVLNEYHFEGEVLMLIKKATTVVDPIVVQIKESNFDWVSKLQAVLRNETSAQRVLVVSQGEPMSGLLGLFNCIRKEPGGENARCFFIVDKKAPVFDPALPFYQEQICKDAAVNVFKDGQWGSYRHTGLEACAMISAKHAYINIRTRGDLSTFQWIQGPLDPYTFKPKQFEQLVHVYYSALNFRDVMTATGKIVPEAITKNRKQQENAQGLEFSGRDSSGRRVMGELISGAMSTVVVADTNLMWEVPDEWTLEDAATVPVVYATAYYALCLSGRMKRGDSVLIHAGSGGVGQAAIYVALHEGCTVFTTVGTQEKRDFIKNTFPQLTDSHIGNSRDTSFEQLIMAETNGRGVDLVLNSLSGEKLLASVRCLALGGRFLEIGKFDLINNTPLGMEIFLKETSFHAIMLDQLFNCPPEWKKPLHDIMVKGIKEGVVRPLSRTVFADNEAEKAFRYMAAGKHIGKVLLKIRDEEKDLSQSPEILLHEARPRFSCDPGSTYIVAGGLGGFGLELADWLVLRGAMKLVLTSRSGIRTGYQSSRVRTWRSYGVMVKISTDDITTRHGVTVLLKDANRLGPVDAIFNLAVVLLDALFDNQTEENFVKSFGPKAQATKHLDAISRKLCPQLKHFVIFSSVSCGRGNAGQTNYGMANSVMERICERRVKEGYPGLAVQWGAVGEVGLVADMQDEDHELVIGGTLQQRISSCLEVLDGFLRQSHPIVASMVVAEKKAGGSGTGNVVDCIANIIGLRDLKTVSLHSTLSELGMDSMMAVEIKQTLEREFELLLTPQDIRGLTFAKLIDLSNAKVTTNKEANREDINEVNIANLQFMLRAIGDEKDSSQPTMVLPSLADTGTSVFLVPGIEGMAFLFEPLAKNLRFQATGLQIGHWKNSLSERASEMAALLLPFVKDSLTSNKEPFRLLGYSFGGLLAMQMALQLEKAGYRGKVFLVDSSPDFLERIVKTQIEANGNEDNLQINLLITILNLLKNQEAAAMKQIQADMAKLGSWEERVEHFLTLVPDSQYSHEYRKSVANLALKRIRATLAFDWPEGATLKSSVTLIRPTVQVLQTVEDYGLGKFCEKPVDVQFVEGDHVTVLDNPAVANIVNTQLSNLVTEYSGLH